MYVRLLAGSDAGKVQDLRWDCAQQMLADGRAELPDAPKAVAVPEVRMPSTPRSKRSAR